MGKGSTDGGLDFQVAWENRDGVMYVHEGLVEHDRKRCKAAAARFADKDSRLKREAVERIDDDSSEKLQEIARGRDFTENVFQRATRYADRIVGSPVPKFPKTLAYPITLASVGVEVLHRKTAERRGYPQSFESVAEKADGDDVVLYQRFGTPPSIQTPLYGFTEEQAWNDHIASSGITTDTLRVGLTTDAPAEGYFFDGEIEEGYDWEPVKEMDAKKTFELPIPGEPMFWDAAATHPSLQDVQEGVPDESMPEVLGEELTRVAGEACEDAGITPDRAVMVDGDLGRHVRYD